MEFLLRFSYLEIYNERIHDLLAAGAKSDIKIYDVHNRAAAGSGNARDGFVTKDVVIKGLREEIVLSTEHVLSLVEVGNLHRHMAMTESNDQSSRSHVVFRMIRRRPRGPAQMSSSNQSTLNERQMELKFAINNINRVILNSSQAQERPDDEELASVDEDTFPAMATPPHAWEPSQPLPQLQTSRRSDPSLEQPQRKPTPRQLAARQQAEVELEIPQTQSRAATRPLLRRDPVRSTSSVTVAQPEPENDEEGKDEDHARPRLVHSGSSANTSNKTLIGSGGSASTKTLPLSTSSSRHLTDGDEDLAETKEEYDGDEEDEPEHEEDAHPTPTYPQTLQEEAPIAPSPIPSAPPARPSLTSMLKTKYLDELSKMDQRAGRWQDTDEGELYKQKELLREFVRGLEIAQAEQETRMSKIRELELENRRLRLAVASRDDELSQLKTETPTQTREAESS
ncbi:unnamed protein product [Phytophthora lilii]|uniref:Unnamed protein product n=1 Tax=Phytophthora lilii TaxID=2077276 RepID=A0A9W6TDJ8_9STRA|nr:unnamed protein product [Phytophthora lilii]